MTTRHERYWAVFPLTRLRPEQVAGSILQAASLKTIDAETHFLFRLRRSNEENEFITRYGDNGEDEFAASGGTIPQRLLMLNGVLVDERTKVEGGPFNNNASARIAVLAPDDRSAVEMSYLATISRRPTRTEQEYFVQRIGDSEGADRNRHLEDLFWSLLNSTEFSWGH